MSKRVCPRCGSVVSWIEHRRVSSRVYLYAVHVDRKTGKRRWCYLGPEEEYVHGVISHESYTGDLRGFGTDFTELWSRNVQYLENLLKSFTTCKYREYVYRALEIINMYIPKIRENLEKLAKEEEQK